MSVPQQIKAALGGTALRGIEESAKSFARLSGKPGVNTALDYSCRDADNYKVHHRAIFRGEITAAQVRAIAANLIDDLNFIPGQVGLLDLAGQMPSDWDDEIDMSPHELISIELTTVAATETETIEAFSRDFTNMTWNQGYRPACTP